MSKTVFTKHIKDIEPKNGRLMYITLDGTLPINIINTYMPTSVESIETKEKAYEQFQNTYDTLKGTGPTYIVGDFNARLIYPGNSTEEEIMGNFRMYDNKEEMRRLREPMLENRELLVQFTLANELRIINSMFKNILEN